jgi:hypothetical protein
MNEKPESNIIIAARIIADELRRIAETLGSIAYEIEGVSQEINKIKGKLK